MGCIEKNKTDTPIMLQRTAPIMYLFSNVVGLFIC